MKTLLTVLAGLTLTAVVATTDFTPPQPMQEVRDPYQAIWTPRVSTDCKTWEIHQREAALKDVWPHVDYMTLDGVEHDTGSFTLPRDGDRVFEFRFHSDAQEVYNVDLEVVTRC